MIKIKDMKLFLEAYDDNDLIVLSRDGEGNGFSPLHTISPQMYKDNDIYEIELSDGYTVDDLCNGEGCKTAIVLWPY